MLGAEDRKEEDIMGLSGKKRNDQPEEKQQEMKVYIQGAGGTIVSKSILNGTDRKSVV